MTEMENNELTKLICMHYDAVAAGEERLERVLKFAVDNLKAVAEEASA